MKQIFDWMRKKPLKAFEVYDGSIGVYPCEVNRLIDEAEAKWESEVCEWKPTGLCEPPRYLEAHDLMVYELDASLWKYCPICGKPIKI